LTQQTAGLYHRLLVLVQRFEHGAVEVQVRLHQFMGVSAIHFASDTSTNTGALNSSRKRNGALPVFSMK